MKQIKTIKYPLNRAEEFDREVNAALSDGWQLIRREVLGPLSTHDKSMIVYAVCYAELEREIITEEERCCENCAHYDDMPSTEPCLSCESNCSKWEPMP